jgi:glycosyltransferase involved in cell wall biosynthesis
VRVLAISSYGVLGGAELSLSTFVEHRPAGIAVEALVLEDGPLAGRLADLGIDTQVPPGLSGRPDLTRLARFTRSLDRLLRSRRPDVVWANGQKAALLAGLACRRRGVPIVWHKVDLSWDRELAMPLALACNGVIGVSHTALEALGPLRSRALGVAGVPIRLPAELVSRPDRERPVIGSLARLIPYKGLHHVIGAAALLRDEFPELRVELAGGPVREYPGYRDELLALARRHDMADRVELSGFVDPVPLLQRLSVFVSATYRDELGFGMEGLPGAALEASWAGVPVVAAEAGGTQEAVLDGRTGTIVAGPEPECLAPAIAAYLRDPELAARTGAAGREYARSRCEPVAASQRLFAMLERAARLTRGERGAPDRRAAPTAPQRP